MIRKLIIFLLILTLSFTLFCGCSADEQKKDIVQSKPTDYKEMMSYWKDGSYNSPVLCWYFDEADQKWLENSAEEFEKKYGISVNVVRYDGVQMLEDINQANRTGAGPDLYIMGNDQLEFAVLGGIASENTCFDNDFWKDNYPEVSKQALTYKEKQYGYPIYFDTYCLVYDSKLLKDAPASIDDILDFLDEYEDTGSTKAIFRWDVADPYINTMFVAAYADLFGENGDDDSSFSINGDKEIEAMKYYQSLSEFLWMDKTNISHETIINRIKDGTLVLGLCKSDILPVLYEMKKNVTSESTASENYADDTDYKIAYVPSLTKELSSECLSTTYGAFINPYTDNNDAANMFALYLSYEASDKQFTANGKIPVKSPGDGFDDMQKVIYAQYINSKAVPKTMLLGDYIQEGGIIYDAIWEGKDVKEQLDKLQTIMEEKMK